ncbi:hypothetical protein QJQ45_020147, partial [Haematococcus lacustris]
MGATTFARPLHMVAWLPGKEMRCLPILLLHFPEVMTALKLCLQIAYIAFLAVLCHGDDTCGLAGDVSNRATEEPGFIDITVPIAAGLPIWSEAHGMPSTFREQSQLHNSWAPHWRDAPMHISWHVVHTSRFVTMQWLAMDMAKGAFAYDSHFTLGAHVGTHVDSVAHFLPSEYEAGNTIDKVCADPLSWRPHAALQRYQDTPLGPSRVVVLSLAGALVMAAGQQLGVVGLCQAMLTEIRVAVRVVMAVMLVGVLAQVPLAVLVGPSLVLQVPTGVTDISGTLTLPLFLTLALPLSRPPLPWPASVLQELNIPSDCQRLLLRTDNTLRSGPLAPMTDSSCCTLQTALNHGRCGRVLWIQLEVLDIQLNPSQLSANQVGIDYLSIGNFADIVGAHLALFNKVRPPQSLPCTDRENKGIPSICFVCGIIPVEGLDLTPLQSGRWYHLTCLPLKIQ